MMGCVYNTLKKQGQEHHNADYNSRQSKEIASPVSALSVSNPKNTAYD